jgi:hypothetical protein
MKILTLLRGSWLEFWDNRFQHSYERFEWYKRAFDRVYEANYDPRKTKKILRRMWIELRIMDICAFFG